MAAYKTCLTQKALRLSDIKIGQTLRKKKINFTPYDTSEPR